MRELLVEIDRALTARAYVLALGGALAVPDIAGALESDGWSKDWKYAAWFDANVGPLINTRLVQLTGENCYRFRCALLHQGSVEDAKPPLDFGRLAFFPPGAAIFGHMNAFGSVLNLDLREFCLAVTRAGEAWLRRVSGTEPYETNVARCVRLRPEGLPPKIVGVPVIA